LSTEKIVFFTGKGGVGKSLVAAGYAVNRAKQGKRVLLIELGETSFYQSLFPEIKVEFEPKRVREGLDLAHWIGPACLRDYILYLVKSEKLLNIVFDNPFMRAFVEIAPSLAELSVVGKVTSAERGAGPRMDYDLIVVDAYATGHMMALLRAPVGMADAIKFGPMAQQSRDILKVLRDAAVTKYFIVTLPEELPVNESIDLWGMLIKEFGIRANLVCNKVVNPPLSEPELKEIKGALSGDEGLVDFVRYLEDAVQRQKEQIERLKKECGDVRTVPNYYTDNSTHLFESITSGIEFS
jgi:anion-transporting  ArsA/GET3 family ATPase